VKESVITELPFIKVEHFSFKHNVTMPLTGRAFIDKDVNVWNYLSCIMGKVINLQSSFTVLLRLNSSALFPALKKPVQSRASKKRFVVIGDALLTTDNDRI
jgi:hypothetical protein